MLWLGPLREARLAQLALGSPSAKASLLPLDPLGRRLLPSPGPLRGKAPRPRWVPSGAPRSRWVPSGARALAAGSLRKPRSPQLPLGGPLGRNAPCSQRVPHGGTLGAAGALLHPGKSSASLPLGPSGGRLLALLGPLRGKEGSPSLGPLWGKLFALGVPSGESLGGDLSESGASVYLFAQQSNIVRH